MKKSFICILALCLLAATATLSAAASSLDFYTPAADGDLLYTVNMYGDQFWKPEKTVGDLQLTVIDEKTANVYGGKNSAQNWYGGEIEGLPLENNAYTIKFTVTRNEKACFGLYVDDIYGVYGYADQYRIMNGPSSLGAHGYINYENVGLEIPGTQNDGTPQNYALEVNGQACTLRLYIMDKYGEYQLVDESYPGEILVFATDNLGIYFYSYYSQNAIVSDIEIYKGMIISGEKLSDTTVPPETSKAPETTKTVETTKAPETSKPNESGETTTENSGGEGTTKAAETTKTSGKKGCGSAFAANTGAIVLFVLSALCLRKKKR